MSKEAIHTSYRSFYSCAAAATDLELSSLTRRQPWYSVLIVLFSSCCDTLNAIAGSRSRDRGTALHAATSALQIPSVQTNPSHAIPSQVPAVLERLTSTDDNVFTASDWDNVLKGYRSQYIEHDFWVDDSMIEGEPFLLGGHPIKLYLPTHCIQY